MVKINRYLNGKIHENLIYKKVVSNPRFRLLKKNTGVIRNKNSRNRIQVFFQRDFDKFMKNQGIFVKTNKRIIPDMTLLDNKKKIAVCVEKKFQEKRGSTDEKIASAPFKCHLLEKMYPGYNIEYVYLLGDFFRHSRYDEEKDFYKNYKNIRMMYSSDPNFLEDIVDIVQKQEKELESL